MLAAAAVASWMLVPTASASGGVETSQLPEVTAAQRAAAATADVGLQELEGGAQDIEDCLQVRDDDDLTTYRYAGLNRYETSACVSVVTWADHDDAGAPDDIKADAVVLARGDLFPDALAGGPLAAYKQAPLLLTRPNALPAVTMAEIDRVLAVGGDIYLLGGDVSISPVVESALTAAGYNTVRLAGANRYETALEVAAELPFTSNFFFVTGRNFPDALAAGTAASAMTLSAISDEDPDTRPVALVLTKDEVVPTAVHDFVNERGNTLGVWALLTAGGQADAAAADAFGAGNLALRFVGSNRYETAALVAEGIFVLDDGELGGAGVGLATGRNFPDALSASPSLAQFAEPLLLTHPTTLPGVAEGFLEAHRGEGQFLDIFGGEMAITGGVEDAAIAAFN